MAKREQQTFYNYKVTTADNQSTDVEYKSEKQFEEAKAEAAKIGSTVVPTKMQSFEVSTAESIEEMLELVPNQAVALGYFNYGVTLAQHNVKRDLMRDSEWTPIEGIYPLINDVQTEREKRVADPMSASRRALKALWSQTHPGQDVPSDDDINAILAQFAATATAV